MSDAQTLQNLDERTLAVHEVRRRTRPPRMRWRTRSFRWRSQISALGTLPNLYCQYSGNQNFKTYT
ncbi:MAG: hypothetical protein V7K94_10610 [Nostoc sp.]|uniref:hypothetical protein n=1 Tax=Nostoc sp. TaxID=1180 RepID=UPI002FF6294F